MINDSTNISQSNFVEQKNNIVDYSSNNLSNNKSSGSDFNSIQSSNASDIPKGNQKNKISEAKPEQKQNFFSRMFDYMKNNWNPWKIEEEEFIDAHGFKCKRPKQKIPLRNKQKNYEDDIQKAGGESMSYASKHSGFGNLFL